MLLTLLLRALTGLEVFGAALEPVYWLFYFHG